MPLILRSKGRDQFRHTGRFLIRISETNVAELIRICCFQCSRLWFPITLPPNYKAVFVVGMMQLLYVLETGTKRSNLCALEKRRAFWFESIGVIVLSAYLAITAIPQRATLRLGRFSFTLTAQHLASCQSLSCFFMLISGREQVLGYCLVFTTNKSCPICIPYAEYVSDPKKAPILSVLQQQWHCCMRSRLLEIPTRRRSLRITFMQCKPTEDRLSFYCTGCFVKGLLNQIDTIRIFCLQTHPYVWVSIFDK